MSFISIFLLFFNDEDVGIVKRIVFVGYYWGFKDNVFDCNVNEIILNYIDFNCDRVVLLFGNLFLC